jgi:hypothetical protein
MKGVDIRMRRIFITSILAVLILSPCQHAGALVIDAFDQGTYNSGYGYPSHNSGDTETGTGQTTYLRPDNPGAVYRHYHNAFFVFDLKSINSDIYSAKLEIELKSYESRDPSESFVVYDVTTPIDELIAGGRHLWNPIGLDLESGTEYGSGAVKQSDVGSIVSIKLSASAIFDLNSSLGGLFAVGAHCITAGNPQPGLFNIDYINFGEQGDGVHRLILGTTPVPEPATMLLLGTGLIGLAGWGKKRYRK